MIGKLIAGFIVVTAVVAGLAMYYLQVYAYYEEVPASGVEDVQLTSLTSGQPEGVLYDSFKAIDSESSPIRYRACFTTTMSQAMLSETYEAYEDAVPLTAPQWFDCFDAREVGAALESGRALAFMGQQNIQYGVDRVVAVMPDGRGFVWHQINACGEVVFDGKRAPAHCPTPPEGD
ncbi:MAG: histidine kinase [Thalassovita sp.]